MLASTQQNLSTNGQLTVGETAGNASPAEPFADVAPTAAGHFDLYFLAATAHLTRQLAQTFGTREALFADFPFLSAYDERLAGREPDNLADEKAADWWEKALAAWEKKSAAHLPLRVLQEQCNVSHSAIILLMCAGLVEEDSRFGGLFETLHELAGQRRVTVGLLGGWWNEQTKTDFVRVELRRLRDLGLIQFGNNDAPRSEWTIQTTSFLWDVLRGEKQNNLADWAKYEPPETLLPLDALVIPDDLRQSLAALPKLIEQEEIQAVIVRSAQHNGRKSLLGALANNLQLGLLEITAYEQKDQERWRIIGTLAALLPALPVFRLDVAPSETFELPALAKTVKFFGVTIGKQGGVGGMAVEKAITLNIKLPEESERKIHWQESFGASQTDELDAISEKFRLSSGNIRRTAQLAKSYARLGKSEKIRLSDVSQAARALNRQALDTLATHLETLVADWSHLAVSAETQLDLEQLEARCRARERLRSGVGAALREQLQTGVRALFSGTSGTGKTFAARLLAAALGMDLYRLDLSTVVNKYIGETEKNLARVFAHVEELDVILLLDEGDALLTQRTNVSNANDRYANLETNYLLQRLESFEGILIVTTNAGGRIDSAFERRMDAVIEFAPPGAAQRWRIWQLHLPENHTVSSAFLHEVVQRCELSGGQIRNVALHAAALAVGNKTLLNRAHLENALRREYRKIGAICPLRENFETHQSFDRW
ncbi:MAG: ATP-binding protein [Pyrinomonadaceae bacterium]